MADVTPSESVFICGANMDNDVLNEFVENICNYCGLTNESVKCNIRKHSENLLRDGDMSFPLHYMTTHFKENETNCELSTSTDLESSPASDTATGSDSKKLHFKEKLNSLNEASANWNLRIEKCEIRRNRVVIYLRKDCAFRTILKNILQAQYLCGSSRLKRKRIYRTTMKHLVAGRGKRCGQLEEESRCINNFRSQRVEGSVCTNNFRTQVEEEDSSGCINNFRPHCVDGQQQLNMPVSPIPQRVALNDDSNNVCDNEDVCIVHPEAQHVPSLQYEVFGDLDNDDEVRILQHKLHRKSVEQGDDMDLSQLRVKYLKDFAVRAAKLTGYDTGGSSEASDCICITLTTKSNKDLPSGMKEIVCGAVVNAKSRTKETNMLAKEYLQLRENDMRTAALHKYGSAVEGDVKWNSLISSLGEAAVKMELLKVKPSQTVSLSLESDYKISREHSSKGATFVLYNYARIISILKQFHDKEENKLYPTLPALDDIDFALLKCDEEWQLLHFIMVYPSVVNSLGKDIEKGVLKPHIICIFLNALCKTFSVYYRRIRILREPRQHLFPTMFARIYLLKALQIILQSSLCLMGIDTVNQM